MTPTPFVQKLDDILAAMRQITLADFDTDEDIQRIETADFLQLQGYYLEIKKMRNEHVRITTLGV